MAALRYAYFVGARRDEDFSVISLTALAKVEFLQNLFAPYLSGATIEQPFEFSGSSLIETAYILGALQSNITIL